MLLIRPSALGDVCRTVPLIVSLRAAFPAAAIDWVVQDAFAGAVAAHPGLSAIVPFPRARLARWYTPRGIAGLWQWAATLRRGRYDLVIDAQGLLRSGLMARATGAPVRVGHADAKELGWLGLNRRVRPDRGAGEVHTVDRMLSLLPAAGVRPIADLRLYTDPASRARAQRVLPGDTPTLVLAPTSRWPGKRWPIERFAALAEGLVGCGAAGRVAVVGTGAEREQCGPLLAALSRLGPDRGVDLVGGLSVAELLAVVERASLVVANDSAALHMAVGLSRPLVALYGPTRVELVGPYGRGADVVQHVEPGDRLDHKDRRAGEAMMARISTAEVRARAEAALRAGGLLAAPGASSPSGAGAGVAVSGSRAGG